MPGRMDMEVKPSVLEEKAHRQSFNSAVTYAGRNKFLFYYAQEHVDFRFPVRPRSAASLFRSSEIASFPPFFATGAQVALWITRNTTERGSDDKS